MFELVSKYIPSGDQPKAIEKLVKGITDGKKEQVLLGATGTGKTFTIANVIKEYSGCEIGFINGGGIRNAAFPIQMNQNITVGLMWEMMPFDNFVKTCTMTTSQIIDIYQSVDILHSDNIEVVNGELYYNGRKCTSDETFTVAAVDYIFDKPEYPFLESQDQQTTGILFRDYLIQAIKDACKDGNKWVC